MIKIEDYTELLYKLVLKSYKNNEIPVGSIVIYNNKIIGKGYNTRQKTNYVCGHAEVNAIKDAEKYINDWRLDNCILISTLKPCNMCSSIIKESRIDRIYYLFDQDKVLNEDNYNKIDYNDKYTELIEDLFSDFFKNIRS